MSGDLLQPGHRAQSARRYRRDGEGLDSHAHFGGATSLGGYTASFDSGAPAGESRADAWHSPEAAATWNVPATATWSPAPTQDHWDAPDSGDAWAAPAAEPGWNAWDDEPGPGTDEPFNPAALGAPDAERPARATPRRTTGAHRLPAPPTALKGRAAVVAVAAGAVVAAGQAGMSQSGGAQHHTSTADYQAAGQIREVAAQSVATNAPGSQSPQVLDVAPVTDISQFEDVLHHGQQFAADLAAQAAAKLRPVFVKFASGTFTSGYGARWGVLHPGVDIAGPIGTPIYAVMDGTVISAGPASGFGMWVRLRHDDGTVTVYGHINTATVTVGQRVMAGDQIATIGNRGFSTGPHCHFEVWLNGTDRIDPLPWLASRGISLGTEED